MRDIKPSVLSKILDDSVLTMLDHTEENSEFEGICLLIQTFQRFYFNFQLLRKKKKKSKRKEYICRSRKKFT